MEEARRHAPATERNRTFILEVLRRVLPTEGTVLEIASGTGQHMAYFASQFSALQWLPTDLDHEALPSIESWCTGLTNVLPAQTLDVCKRWPDLNVDAVLNINMIHISPWSATQGLFSGARGIIKPDGMLYLYGPFMRDGRHTAASNAQFDEKLRSVDPRWGVRDLNEVVGCANEHGFSLDQVIGMPANNMSVIFRRSSPEMP
ncbi:MAG: DUF938 domain-containing protein [Myxococcota bacterium]|nr:DUF938 domain-containing protein [Myxococcota bacterium]